MKLYLGPPRILVLVLFLICAFIPSTAFASNTGQVQNQVYTPARAAPQGQGATLVGTSTFLGVHPPSPDPPAANWDEQIGLTFTDSFTSMAYNVTAVAQTDTDGYGPAYLLNGLSNVGYWYQVGVSYNWPYVTGGYVTGFQMNYNVFAPDAKVVDPASGNGGSHPFSGPVNPGDKVLLSLSFSGGNVVMYARDWNTGATASESYSAESATFFQGSTSGYSNSNGFFTGLMTEQYHVKQYYGGEQQVQYTETDFAQPSAWMWIDEWNSNTSATLFSDYTTTPVAFTNPYQLKSFSSDGAAELADAYEFDTGQSQFHLNVSTSPVKADVDTSVQVSFTATVSGGSAPYRYVVFLDDHIVDNFSSTLTTIQRTYPLGFLTQGPHLMMIEAYDSNGLVSESQATSFMVNPDPTITIFSQRTTFDQGQEAVIGSQISYGTPPYKVIVMLNGNPVAGTGGINLSKLGQNQIVANLTDAAGYTVLSNVLDLQVNPDPTVTLSDNASTTDVGLQVLVSEEAANGTSPYSVSWFVDGKLLQTGGIQLALDPNSTGEYMVEVVLADSAGFSINSTGLSIVVNPSPIANMTVNPVSTNFLISNDAAHVTVKITGGTSPFAYTWLLNGAPVARTSVPYYNYSFATMGSNQIQVRVSDGAGAVFQSNQVVVHYQFNLAHMAAIIALVAATVTAVLVTVGLRGRKKSGGHGNQTSSVGNFV